MSSGAKCANANNETIVDHRSPVTITSQIFRFRVHRIVWRIALSLANKNGNENGARLLRDRDVPPCKNGHARLIDRHERMHSMQNAGGSMIAKSKRSLTTLRCRAPNRKRRTRGLTRVHLEILLLGMLDTIERMIHRERSLISIFLQT